MQECVCVCEMLFHVPLNLQQIRTTSTSVMRPLFVCTIKGLIFYILIIILRLFYVRPATWERRSPSLSLARSFSLAQHHIIVDWVIKIQPWIDWARLFHFYYYRSLMHTATLIRDSVMLKHRRRRFCSIKGSSNAQSHFLIDRLPPFSASSPLLCACVLLITLWVTRLPCLLTHERLPIIGSADLLHSSCKNWQLWWFAAQRSHHHRETRAGAPPQV